MVTRGSVTMDSRKNGFHLIKGALLLMLMLLVVWYVLFCMRETGSGSMGTLVDNGGKETRHMWSASCGARSFAEVWPDDSVCAHIRERQVRL